MAIYDFSASDWSSNRILLMMRASFVTFMAFSMDHYNQFLYFGVRQEKNTSQVTAFIPTINKKMTVPTLADIYSANAPEVPRRA